MLQDQPDHCEKMFYSTWKNDTLMDLAYKSAQVHFAICSPFFSVVYLSSRGLECKLNWQAEWHL